VTLRNLVTNGVLKWIGLNQMETVVAKPLYILALALEWMGALPGVARMDTITMEGLRST
jgi:hypothetical protein